MFELIARSRESNYLKDAISIGFWNFYLLKNQMLHLQTVDISQLWLLIIYEKK